MRIPNPVFRLFFSCFAFLIFSPLLFANSLNPISNGAVAKAYPVEKIRVDGAPSDWANGLAKYPILINYGERVSATDFEAFFQVGYNLAEKALYLLVTVQDDDHIVDTSENADWNTQDTWNLYLDRKHSQNGSGVNLFQYGDEFKDVANPNQSWDKDEKNFGWDRIKIASSRVGTTTYYEARIDLGADFKLGKIFGLDHVFIDMDSGDEPGNGSFISWGHDTGKSQSPTRLGDVYLVPQGQNMSQLNGTLAWEDTSREGMTNRLRIAATKNTDLWTVVRVDSLGKYTAELPAGNYRLSPYWESYSNGSEAVRLDQQNSTIEVSVKEGNSTTAPQLTLRTKETPDLLPAKGILKDFNPNNPQQLDNFVKTYQQYYMIPGVSLALIRDGEVIYHKTYGVKNNYSKELVDGKTLFEAASITKPVFAYGVCRLAERGVIDLDKPLYEYLPFEAIAHDDRYKLITARHVMSHQTGFPNWAWMNDDGKLDIKFTPGTDYGYSGEGFEYLKRVVVAITGMHINDFLDAEVLTPLGLKNTYFSENDYLRQVVSHGHIDNRPTRANLPGEPGMAWSMHTEAKSFTAFALGLLNRKGLTTETYDEMFKVQTAIPFNEDYDRQGWENFFGLGIHMEKTPFGPTFGHGGNNGDFKCEFKMYPEQRSGFVVFTNSDNGDMLHNDLNYLLFTGKLAAAK